MRWCVEGGGDDGGGGEGGGDDGGGGGGGSGVLRATHFFLVGVGGCHGPGVPKML